jgi:hypothetical protein
MSNITVDTKDSNFDGSTDKMGKTKATKKSSNGKATKVERGPDGKPQLPKRAKHDVQVGMRLSEEEEHQLLSDAAATGCTSMSNYLRTKCGLTPLR